MGQFFAVIQQWMVGVLGGGVVLWLVQRIFTRSERKEDRAAAAAVREHDDREQIINQLRQEVSRKDEEIKQKVETIASLSLGIEQRTKEALEWREVNGQLKERITRRKLEIFLFRRRDAQILSAQTILKDALSKIKECPQDCLQIVDAVIAKLNEDIEIPEDEVVCN